VTAASWIEIAKAALGLGLEAWRMSRETAPAPVGVPRIRTADELLLEAAKRRTGGTK
jgi:hypothetical protein